MGKRGPKPEPAAWLQLKGSWRGKDRKDETVEPTDEIPAPPGWIPEAQHDTWLLVAGHLVEIGRFHPLFTISLALLVGAVHDYWKCRQTVEAEGYATVGSTGNAVLRPEAKQMQAAWQQIERMAGEFGLTPSTAANVAGVFKGAGMRGGDDDVAPFSPVQHRRR